MRNTDILRGIHDVARLQAWLYADEEHEITVLNSAGAELRLSMNEDGETLCRFNIAGTWTKPRPYDENLSIPIWLGIIEQLERQTPEPNNPNTTSRWDKIKFEYGVIAVLNKIN